MVWFGFKIGAVQHALTRRCVIIPLYKESRGHTHRSHFRIPANYPNAWATGLKQGNRQPVGGPRKPDSGASRKHWRKGAAVGKLNGVRRRGKEPRLVLDSTVCGVNSNCSAAERMSLPMEPDVRLAFLPEDS